MNFNQISTILNWLRKNVHHYGRSVNAEELVERVTGSTLSSKFFLEYLENKVEKLALISD